MLHRPGPSQLRLWSELAVTGRKARSEHLVYPGNMAPVLARKPVLQREFTVMPLKTRILPSHGWSEKQLKKYHSCHSSSLFKNKQYICMYIEYRMYKI